MSDKATQSEARTRSLYDEAVAASDNLRVDLEPRIESAKNDVKQGRGVFPSRFCTSELDKFIENVFFQDSVSL